VKEVAQLPPTYSRDDSLHQNSQTITNKIKLSLKFTLSHKQLDLTPDEFIFLVKLICHPLVSPTNRALLILIKSLEELFPQGKLCSHFESVSAPLIDYAFRSRSGILSPNPTLRAMAINIGVALSSQKLMTAFIGDVVTILNYKPLEMVNKLERIFREEFDRISFYDLMLYSEVSKDLLNVFRERDQGVVKRELGV